MLNENLLHVVVTKAVDGKNEGRKTPTSFKNKETATSDSETFQG